MEDFETGALLHAILAWPKPSEEEELKTAVNALCTSVIEATLKQDPSRCKFVVSDVSDYGTELRN